MTHRSQFFIKMQSYGYKPVVFNYFDQKQSRSCPSLGTRQRWHSGCVSLLGQQGAVWAHRSATAVSHPLHAHTHTHKKNPSLESKERKLLYNKISSSHLGISATEYFFRGSLSLSEPFYP